MIIQYTINRKWPSTRPHALSQHMCNAFGPVAFLKYGFEKTLHIGIWLIDCLIDFIKKTRSSFPFVENAVEPNFKPITLAEFFHILYIRKVAQKDGQTDIQRDNPIEDEKGDNQMDGYLYKSNIFP